MEKKQVTHIMAVCHMCGKEWSNYSNAQELAIRHADMYGHDIVGELAVRFHYEGKKKKK